MKITSLDLPTDVESLIAGQDAIELPEGCQPTQLATGLMTWHNPVNKFCVIRLHHSADPLKRTQAYIDQAKSGIDMATFLREYELHWESLEGKPVYSDDFSREFHVARASLGWNPRLPVCRGWDFGLYPACVFAQLLSFNRLIVLREACGEDISTERFVDEVSRLSSQWFPDATFYEFIDPTGNNRVGTDGRTYANLLTARPLSARRIIRGANAPAARKKAVVEFLKTNVKGQPCLLIDPSCDVLIKGFGGGYLYAYKKGTLKPKPEKNFYSHIHDALQYLATRVKAVDLKLQQQTRMKVDEPTFGGRTPDFETLVGADNITGNRRSGGMAYGS